MERQDSASSATETGSAAPVLDHSNAPQSQDFLLNEPNVPDSRKLPQETSASLDAKPEGLENESTQDITNTDAFKVESSASKPEPEPSNVFLKTLKTPEEGQTMYASPGDRVEETAHILPGSHTDGAHDIVKDVKYEDSSMDLPLNKSLGSVKEHHKPDARGIDTVEAAVHDSAGLHSDQASSAGAKSEGIPPKYTENAVAAPESKGLDAGQVKRNGSLSKELGLHRQGSSHGDDSWTCRRCGWVYPNAHPSAKHRKKHKKQCGKVKGFELHTEPHTGGSSDEVSSDEDVHVKKEHILHPPVQLLQPEEQANETVARESLPSNVNQSASFVEGDGTTESATNSLQSRESYAQVDAPDKEVGEAHSVEEILTPDTVPSNIRELPQNVPFLDQQNLLAGDAKKDLSDEPGISSPKESDISSTKKSPRHLSMKEVDSLLQAPSSPTSVDPLASESHGELGKNSNAEHRSRIKSTEEPAGLLAERAPDATSIPSVSESMSSDAPLSEGNGASLLEVDKLNAIHPAQDPRGAGLNNETLGVSAGEGLSEGVIRNEAREKPGSNDPLRKDMETAVTRKSTGQPESEIIPHDLSSHTSPADGVPVENKSTTEDLLPVTALSAVNGTGLAKNENEEDKFLERQSDANPVQLVPRNELSAQIVGGSNDDAVFLSRDKTDETLNIEHLADNQMTPSSIDKTHETSPVAEAVLDNRMASIDDAPKEVNIPALTSREAVSIQRSLDEFPSKDNVPVAEGSGQADTEQNLENTEIAEEPGVIDTAKERDAGGIAKGISSAKDGVIEETEASGVLEAIVKPGTEGETPLKTEGIRLSEEMAKPRPKDETISEREGVSPSETEGIAASELSYHDTYSFPRSDSLVTAPSGFSLISAPSDAEALFHKNSDSLEIFEDAPDSLDTCSVGGSVDENENWDEYRQASGRLREGPEHLGAASLKEKLPSESATAVTQPKDLGAASLAEPKSVGAAASDEPGQGESAMAKKELFATNGSRSGEASSEERASTLPGTSYGGRSTINDLKAPSPEAWQEPGPSNVKSEGKKVSTSEVTEDSKSGEGSVTALRNLMAKEGQDKAEPVVETSAPAGSGPKSVNRKEGSAASPKGPKPKSRSFWRYCACCSAVN